MHSNTAVLTSRPDDSTDMQNDILAGNSLGQITINPNQHILGLGLRKCGSGQHMLHFRGANAKRHGAKGTVRGRMGIATHGRAAGQRKSLLRSDNVDNALPFVGHAKVLESEIGHILLELEDLGPAGGLLDEALDRNELRAIRRGDVVIDGYQSAIRPTDRAVGEA